MAVHRTCCIGYGAALASAALSIGRVPLAISLGLVVVAGVCGPVLTAGLSSQLSLMVPQETSIQRRAQGLDALTYGVAGSVGPAIVASIATASTPLAAVLALSGTAVVAGALMMMLPAVVREDGRAPGTALGMRQVLTHVVRTGGLRRAMAAMMMISSVAGSLAILAVGRGTQLRGDAGSGALLMAVAGAIGFTSAGIALAIGGTAIVLVSVVLILDRYQRPAVLSGAP